MAIPPQAIAALAEGGKGEGKGGFGLGMLGGLFKAGFGLFQTLKGRQQRHKAMRQLAEDPYEIPETARRGVDVIAEQAAGTQLPGQQLMEERLASGTAAGVGAARRAATSPSQVLAATVEGYRQQQQQQQEIDLASAQDYQRRQQAYAQAVQTLAPYEEQAWKYKTLYPVQARLNAASQFSAAGQQNIAGGISEMFSMGANKQAQQNMQQQGVATPATSSGVFADAGQTTTQSAPFEGFHPPQTQNYAPFDYNQWMGGLNTGYTGYNQ